jgi:hypothetical protein
MNKINSHIVLFVFILLCPALVNAQAPTDRGEIEGRQVIIEKNLEITLPKADRNFEKVPPPADPDINKEGLNYDMSYVDNSGIPDLNPSLRVLKIKTERPPQLYENYVKLGFGNYLSPYLALYLHNTPNKNASYGANFLHNSAAKGPVDNKNSGNGLSQLKLNGKYMGNKATTNAELGYSVETYRFYGYDREIAVDRDTIKQNFNTINVGLSANNSDLTSNLKLNGGINFSYKVDNYNVSESAFDVKLKGYYTLSEEMGAGLDMDFDFRNYKNDLTIKRNLVNIMPYLTFQMDLLSVKAGFRVVSNNDALDNVNDIAIFPAVTADYHLSDNFIIFGIMDGNVEKVNFTNSTEINPYLNSDISFYNTIKTLEIGGGIRGTLVNNLGYRAGATFAGYKNLFFFVNDSVAKNKFDVIYDTDITNILKLDASLTYSVEKKYGAEIAIKYYGYSTGDVAEAWHRPKSDFTVGGWYNLYDKILISTDLRLLSGIKALDPSTLETVNLATAFDWNAEINYRFSEKAGAFIMLNNIIGKKYETLYRYPVRGLQVKLGVSLSF